MKKTIQRNKPKKPMEATWFARKKEKNLADSEMVSQTSKRFFCIDGRHTIAIINFDQKTNKYSVVKANEELSRRQTNPCHEVGPQVFGGSLGFVEALKQKAGFDLENPEDLEKAFSLVERASRELGFGLQIHIDNEHGHFDLLNKEKAEIIEWFRNYRKGCGFAKFAFEHMADFIVQEAIKRGWPVEVLDGIHEENGAQENWIKGKTYNRNILSRKKRAKFSTDLHEVKKMFVKLGELLKDANFAERAMDWYIKTYRVVAVSLKGVTDASQIKTVGQPR